MSKCNFKILRFLVLRFDIQYVQSKLNYCRYLLCKPATHPFGFRFGWMTGTGWLQHAFRISAICKPWRSLQTLQGQGFSGLF